MIDLKKKYKTRDGRAVKLYTVTANPPYCVHGAIENDLASWTADGHSWGTRTEYQEDLLEVKPEIEGWVNIYSTDKQFLYIHETREIADKEAKGSQRLACIKIKFTEGEGL
jgi:hypothetical protein